MRRKCESLLASVVSGVVYGVRELSSQTPSASLFFHAIANMVQNLLSLELLTSTHFTIIAMPSKSTTNTVNRLKFAEILLTYIL